MNNDPQNWQTWAALVIVVITFGVFMANSLRKKKPGCGGGCGCTPAKKLK